MENPEKSLTPVGDIRLALAWMTLLLLSVRVPNYGFLALGVLPALFYSVLSIGTGSPSLRRIWKMTFLAAGGGMSAAIFVSLLADGTRYREGSAIEVLLWLGSIAACTAAVMASLQFLKNPKAAILASSILACVSGAQYFSTNENAWKTYLGYPIILGALAVSQRHAKWSVLVLIAGATFSLVYDTRSLALSCGVAAAVILARQTNPGRGRGLFKAIALTACVVIAGMYAMAHGFLGVELQERFQAQAASPGGIISGARPETYLTVKLFETQPWGFGVGAEVAPGTRAAVLSSFSKSGGDAYNPYYRLSVLGERVDLHSVAANLWYHFSLGGLVLAVLLGSYLLRGILHRNSTTIGVFACAQGAVTLLFSPMQQSDQLVIGLAYALTVTSSTRRARVAHVPARSRS